MIDLDTFLGDDAPPENAVASYGGNRTKIPEDELEARLDYYVGDQPDFTLTDRHRQAMKAVFHDHDHVLVTGGAGTGKTTFVRDILIPELEYRGLHFAVLASTGIAGSHLDGKTLHSFFGLPPEITDWPWLYPTSFIEYKDDVTPGDPTPNPQDMSQEELDAWYEMTYHQWRYGPGTIESMKQGILKKIRSHEILLIDEISMVHGDRLLGFIDFLCRRARGDERPFGGLQMVFVGDFAQLPPVEERSDASRPDWAFLARCWVNARVQKVELDKIFRQGDAEFIKVLANIRRGIVTKEDREFFKSRKRDDMTFEETAGYTYLCPKKQQAADRNSAALAHYPGPTLTLDCEFQVYPGLQTMDKWDAEKPHKVREKLLKRLQVMQANVPLRIGAPVMFTVNDPKGRFVNGTRGYLREFNRMPRTEVNGYQDEDYAVVGVTPRGSDTEELIEVKRIPITYTREHRAGATIFVPADYEHDGPEPIPDQISKYPTLWQFPLIPATAISIHKSQGMSMDSAIVELASSFAPGQVYVGLSRLTSPEGLVMLDDEFNVQVDSYVLNFYDQIEDSQDEDLVP